MFGPKPPGGDLVDYAEQHVTATGRLQWERRKRAPSHAWSAANSRMRHDETRVHALKATHTKQITSKTDHIYIDSYPAVHTTVHTHTHTQTHTHAHTYKAASGMV